MHYNLLLNNICNDSLLRLWRMSNVIAARTIVERIQTRQMDVILIVIICLCRYDKSYNTGSCIYVVEPAIIKKLPLGFVVYQ